MMRTAVLGLALLVPASLRADLTIQVRDSSGTLLPCRVHLKNAAGEAQRAEELPFWNDHFVCSGSVRLDLADGNYQYLVERGPEYERASGMVAVSESSRLEIELKRITDLAAEGWWSGELHVHRSIDEMPLHLRAEDLHVAPVITWWNGRNLWTQHQIPESTLVTVDADRFYDVMAGEDEREGGALMYYGLGKPLDLPGGSDRFPEFPSPMVFLQQAKRQANAWIDIEKPFWWDTPVWVASGQIDSIGLANNHMCHSTMLANEAWGKPRDAGRLPPPRGNGFWTQEIYYNILNAGLRVPPSAGSASGVLPNPVGYNRVYVHLDQPISYEAWWQGLKAGRSFVTNGPLIICRADGELPGTVFSSPGGAAKQIALQVELVSNDSVPALELIKNGELAQTIRLEDPHRATVRAKLEFSSSGWFLVRAIADNQQTFRFASSAPFYVEIGDGKLRISKQAVQFFLDWVDERMARVPAKLEDEQKRSQVLLYHQAAKRFWTQRLAEANAP